MVTALRSRPRVIRVMIVLLALIFAATAFAIFTTDSASARSIAPAAGPTPSPSNNTPASAAQSIGIWIRIAIDKSNVPNATITVTGPNGFSATVVSGADGRATVPVAKTGTYKVLLDKTTIPAGLSVLGDNPRDVQVDTENQGVPAYYLLGDGALGGATPTPGKTSSPSTSSGGGPTFAEVVLPRVATGLIYGLLIALASVGVSLIYGTTGLNNFAHGELVTFGGLVGYVVSGVMHMPSWLGILSALVLGGIFGYLQDLGLWKPLRKRGIGLIPLMIVSIGLSLALRYIFNFIFGPDLLVTPSDSSSFLTLGPVHLRFWDVVSPIICSVVLLLVAFAMLRTRIGKATRAVADNRSLAAATGINVERVIRIVWVAGGALAGLSGALIGYYQPVSWETGASILLLIFAAVTLGGFGSAFGALVGSLIIGLLIDLSTSYGFVPSNLKLVAALAVMIVILLFRPQGILGRKDRIG
ncbi:branched-chain amino acid ABC transporter permease [Glaciihabitans sp. GrIS 2.15]|uniref:branched-chain amino acid ABC transporter permease n=1 Tax=Glaciihabitans sp. GrIS 2.15 TaxID=3071710 RepID=UPI002E0765CB|nr:branched-subunit amino acid ABC-type transport system permease component [Glaciihabitans sp. GrIS 2.15]